MKKTNMTDLQIKPIHTAPSFTSNNESIIRKLYQVAEVKDYAGFAALFTNDGVFIDEGTGHAYRGAKELARAAEIYVTAMPDTHRELYDVYVAGDRVVVELSLNGTSVGPLEIPGIGFIPPTGKKAKAPCCNGFASKEGGRLVPLLSRGALTTAQPGPRNSLCLNAGGRAGRILARPARLFRPLATGIEAPGSAPQRNYVE